MSDANPSGLVVVSWEFRDGSCGQRECASREAAELVADLVGEYFREVRVWIDDEIVNRGFVAADERGPS